MKWLLILALAGCAAGDPLCDIAPRAPVTVHHLPQVVVQGQRVGGHWRSRDRAILIDAQNGRHLYAHEMHHAALTDAGVPKADHHAIMRRCGTY